MIMFPNFSSSYLATSYFYSYRVIVNEDLVSINSIKGGFYHWKICWLRSRRPGGVHAGAGSRQFGLGNSPSARLARRYLSHPHFNDN